MANICRICMSQVSNTTDIYENISQGVVVMIEFCTGILLEKSERLPSQICNTCLTDLRTAHRFKTKCIESEKAFQELLKVNADYIKLEPETEYRERDDIVDFEVRDDFDVEIKCEEVNLEVKNDENTPVKRNTVEDRSKKNSSDNKKQQVAKRKKTLPSEAKFMPRRGVNKFRRLFCEPCQLKFSNRQESEKHKKNFHKEEQTWICEVCGKAYAHRSSQIAHMRSHYAAGYACDACDYSTYNKYDLIKHVRIHTGVKSYRCARCPAAYRTSSNLRAHVRLRHERVRAHACTVCAAAFHDRATLARHLDAHSDIKRHVCEVCNTGFTKRSYWKKHMKKQHDISIPDVRPGPPKTNIVILDRCLKTSR